MINAANAPKVEQCWCCTQPLDKPGRFDSYPIVGTSHRVCGGCDRKTKRNSGEKIGNAIAKYHRTMDKLEAKERAEAEKRAAREERRLQTA